MFVLLPYENIIRSELPPPEHFLLSSVHISCRDVIPDGGLQCLLSEAAPLQRPPQLRLRSRHSAPRQRTPAAVMVTPQLLLRSLECSARLPRSSRPRPRATG